MITVDTLDGFTIRQRVWFRILRTLYYWCPEWAAGDLKGMHYAMLLRRRRITERRRR